MVQSFSKNFGLYGQRIGALSVVGVFLTVLQKNDHLFVCGVIIILYPFH